MVSTTIVTHLSMIIDRSPCGPPPGTGASGAFGAKVFGVGGCFSASPGPTASPRVDGTFTTRFWPPTTRDRIPPLVAVAPSACAAPAE